MGEAEGAEAISEEEVSALLEKDRADAVRSYDFTAQRIDRTHLPLLEVIAKSFAERASTSLCAFLGRDATMKFMALESARCADLQAALPMPASLAVIRLKPLPGQAFVSVEPKLLMALLDCYFGGSGRTSTDPAAAVAPAAQRFLALLLRSLAADLAAAWAPVTTLEFELAKQETNPRLMGMVAPQESLRVLKFTVETGQNVGGVDWLLPESLLAPVREALAVDGGQTPLRKQDAWLPSLSAALRETRIEARAILAQPTISLRELARLSPGDIIPIEEPQKAILYADEVALYRGHFGVSQGHYAVKILPGGLK